LERAASKHLPFQQILGFRRHEMLHVYQPEQWHDLFVMVGGGAATLAGLVFVAMSLNLATRNIPLLGRPDDQAARS
jgi:hypothetical protein